MADESIIEEESSSSPQVSPVPPPKCLPDEWRPAISFFKDCKNLQILMNYNQCVIQSDIDWTDGTSLQTVLPCLKTKTGRKLGQRQIPQALLLDAETPHQKLWVVNWWRSLSSSQQSDEFEKLRLVYRAPTKSNEPFMLLLPAQETIHKAAPSTITTELQQPRQESHISWSFLSISTSQELAEKLFCPVDALWCAEMDPNTTNTTCCNVEHCPYPAITRNRNKCAWHRPYWYPRQDKQNRGYLLLGPLYANRQQLAPLCICNDETCRGIGYACDMVRVPSNNATVRQAIVEILGLDQSVLDKFSQQTLSKAYLAPWHFLPQHRTMRPNGTWRLNPFGPKDVFSDDDENNTEWVGFPPPSYLPRKFLETDLSRVDVLPPNRQGLLPKWVQIHRTKEEGPRTILQWQYEQSQQTEDRLLGQLGTWDVRVESSELENYRLRQQVAQLEHNQHHHEQQSSSINNNPATSKRKRQRVHQRELEDEDNDDDDHEPLDLARHRHPLDHESRHGQQYQEDNSRQQSQRQHHYPTTDHPYRHHPHPDWSRWA
jgi:hypothetical protein